MTKDAEYHRKKRSEETIQEQNERKLKEAEYRYRKREDGQLKEQEKWVEIHRQTNLKELKKHGSYLRFLWYGTPRKSFYGCALPIKESVEKVKEWKWLQNKVSNNVLMGSEFPILSKKYALLFNQIGLSRNDVVHLAVGNENDVFGVLGGIWLIGGVASFTNDSTDEKTLEKQVSC